MLPSFKKGDQVISLNWSYIFKKPEIGDVVVIAHQGIIKIKRIQKVRDHEIFVVWR
jgi:signal peptidase I